MLIVSSRALQCLTPPVCRTQSTMVAASVKMNAYGARTFFEVCTQLFISVSTKHPHEIRIQTGKAHFGTSMHMLFAFYGFLCILVVCGSLLHTYMVLPSTCRHLFLKYLVDGAATVNAFKGMNVIVAYFLPPIGITVAVIFRGLCATLMCDWAHTIILFIVVHLCMGHFLYDLSSKVYRKLCVLIYSSTVERR